ncbi:MAG: leucine-rich repeat domain-containing protein [Aureispira sp.]|nr:leucine-rich repeat domain-containing protein [Aureispira sp.]
METDYKKIKMLLQHREPENKELGFQLLKGAGLPTPVDSWIFRMLMKKQDWLLEGLGLGWATQLAPITKSLYLELKSNQVLPKEVFDLHQLKRLYLRFEGGSLNMPNIKHHFGKLEELRLSRNNLTKLPMAILQAPNLKTLHLESNKLTDLPIELAQMASLKNLYLERNKLEVWPANLSKFSQLHFLSLKHNQLKEIPEEIYDMTNLEALNLSYNQIKRLPYTLFCGAPMLRYISVKENPIKNPTTSLFPFPIRNRNAIITD